MIFVLWDMTVTLPTTRRVLTPASGLLAVRLVTALVGGRYVVGHPEVTPSDFSSASNTGSASSTANLRWPNASMQTVP